MTSSFGFAVLASTVALIFSQSVNEENQINVIETPIEDSSRSRSENAFRHMLPSLPNRNPTRPRARDIETLRQSFENGEWAPSGVSSNPGPTNCVVEIQLTQKIPGRCTRLGGRIPACQAQDIVTLDYATCSD